MSRDRSGLGRRRTELSRPISTYLDLSLRADLSYLGLSRAGGRGTGRRRRQGILISIARFTTAYHGLARFGAGGLPNGLDSQKLTEVTKEDRAELRGQSAGGDSRQSLPWTLGGVAHPAVDP
jgi:hypothetical protein